jgi:hypothetical protein
MVRQREGRRAPRRAHEEECLSCLSFPESHRRRIHSTNPLESRDLCLVGSVPRRGRAGQADVRPHPPWCSPERVSRPARRAGSPQHIRRAGLKTSILTRPEPMKR